MCVCMRVCVCVCVCVHYPYIPTILISLTLFHFFFSRPYVLRYSPRVFVNMSSKQPKSDIIQNL